MSFRRSKERRGAHAVEMAAAEAALERARRDQERAEARQPFIDALTKSAGRAQVAARNQRIVINHLGETVASALREGPEEV